MKVLKVINNNVISSVDDNDKEVVVMGKGIGFQKRTGDLIDDEKVEKVFHLPDENTQQFKLLVSDMPYEHMQMAKEIIQYARTTLNRHLNKNIYITLTDHLNYAIERAKQGISFQNALLWEIKKYYTEEYKIGCEAIRMVKEKLSIELPEDEAGFIALHLVNAQMDGDIRQTVSMPSIIKDIISIVMYTFNVAIEEDTLYYERFVTHLKFFLQRAVHGEFYETDDMEFNRDIQRKLKKEYACSLRIKEYLEKKMNYKVTEEELTYLSLHISRLVIKNKNQ